LHRTRRCRMSGDDLFWFGVIAFVLAVMVLVGMWLAS
jgi:hypothetical protein